MTTSSLKPSLFIFANSCSAAADVLLNMVYNIKDLVYLHLIGNQQEKFISCVTQNWCNTVKLQSLYSLHLLLMPGARAYTQKKRYPSVPLLRETLCCKKIRIIREHLTPPPRVLWNTPGKIFLQSFHPRKAGLGVSLKRMKVC
jgi:hypothetical protein